MIASSTWCGTTGFRLGICLHDGTLIGTLGLGPEGDIAYFIGCDHWGQGFASEALARFVPWVFDTFDIRAVEAEVLSDNPASGAILRKLGFETAGESTCRSLARLEAQASTHYRLSRNAGEDRHEIS